MQATWGEGSSTRAIEIHEYEEVNVAAPSSPTYGSTTPLVVTPVYAETDMCGIGAGAADPEYVLLSKMHKENYVRGLEKSASPERQMARLGAHTVSSDYAIPIMRPASTIAPSWMLTVTSYQENQMLPTSTMLSQAKSPTPPPPTRLPIQ